MFGQVSVSLTLTARIVLEAYSKQCDIYNHHRHYDSFITCITQWFCGWGFPMCSVF